MSWLPGEGGEEFSQIDGYHHIHRNTLHPARKPSNFTQLKRSTKTNERWIETSRREQSVAIQLAEAFRDRLSSDLMPSAIDSIAKAIYINRYDHIASEFKDILTPLKSLVSGSFARSDEDLSSNLFARLAFLLGRNTQDHKLAGSVATPYFLAQEMIYIALFTRLEKDVSSNTAKKIRLILSNNESCGQLTTGECNTIQSLINAFKWCDPSLGGGVFPIAIINTLHKLGVSFADLEPGIIDAFEICPYAIAAAKIRIAQSISLIKKVSYEIAENDPCVSIYEKDALEAMPEVRELLTLPRSYDFVVGNPPYVRSDILAQEIKTSLHRQFPSLGAKNLDLYFYFVASGLIHLKSKGILAFVSSASFQRTRHGALLRNFIARYGKLRALIDFGELRVFREANVPHTSVYVIEAGKFSDKTDTQGALLEFLPDSSLLQVLNDGFKIPSQNISEKIWYISKSAEGDLVQNLFKNSISLKQVLGSVYSGIKVGCVKAYVLTEAEHRALIDSGADKSLFRRVLVPTDIRPWQAEWSGHFIIFTPRGLVLDPSSPVFQHLTNFSDTLCSRNDIKCDEQWYSLRSCAYYSLFESTKIVFPDISREPRFYFDNNSFHLCSGAFFIQCDNPIFASLLNSQVGAFYFRRTCSSIGHHEFGGRLRFKKTYVEEFPIPKSFLSDADVQRSIETAAEQLRLSKLSPKSQKDAQEELTRTVLAAYGLTKTATQQIRKAMKV
jgi:hypothetical protein